MLAAAVLSNVSFPAFYFVLLGLVMSFLNSVGMCLIDLVDAEIDKASKPERLIPAGRVSKQAALILIVGLLLLPLLLQYFVYQDALFASLLLIGLIILLALSIRATP
ncbi:UbiA family prenyltransferase [Malonomonas rubra]|uniref:UbiA family prenyltransferase n=1 Tax=Malonomonas rubra TaxID=57040 RepID=UPI0026EBD68C|nr:UbiA family prenyltransferase [Malonomonas rubra]